MHDNDQTSDEIYDEPGDHERKPGGVAAALAAMLLDTPSASRALADVQPAKVPDGSMTVEQCNDVKKVIAANSGQQTFVPPGVAVWPPKLDPPAPAPAPEVLSLPDELWQHNNILINYDFKFSRWIPMLLVPRERVGFRRIRIAAARSWQEAYDRLSIVIDNEKATLDSIAVIASRDDKSAGSDIDQLWSKNCTLIQFDTLELKWVAYTRFPYCDLWLVTATGETWQKTRDQYTSRCVSELR